MEISSCHAYEIRFRIGPPMRPRALPTSVVAQLPVPVRAALGRQVEEVPDRFEGSDMSRILAAVPRCVKELRAPEVPDFVSVAMEHGEHRSLVSLGRLCLVVAVVTVLGRRQKPKPPPAALASEREDARER